MRPTPPRSRVLFDSPPTQQPPATQSPCSTTIVTFLTVFVIQNTQNRDTAAVQLKLDELIRANENARNVMLGLEDLTEEQLKRISTLWLTIAASEERRTIFGSTCMKTTKSNTGHRNGM